METRTQDLYNLILRNDGLNVQEICDALPKYYSYNPSESNYSNCPTLYKDIDTINASAEFEKIIIKDNNCFKVGTEEEAREYATKMQVRALKMLKKFWNVYHKANKDQHLDLFTDTFINAFKGQYTNETQE